MPKQSTFWCKDCDRVQPCKTLKNLERRDNGNGRRFKKCKVCGCIYRTIEQSETVVEHGDQTIAARERARPKQQSLLAVHKAQEE